MIQRFSPAAISYNKIVPQKSYQNVCMNFKIWVRAIH